MIYKVLPPSPVFTLPTPLLLHPLSGLNPNVSVFALAVPSFPCSTSKVLPSFFKCQLNWEASLPNQVWIHGHPTCGVAQSPGLAMLRRVPGLVSRSPVAVFNKGLCISFLHGDPQMMHWTCSSPSCLPQRKTDWARCSPLYGPTAPWRLHGGRVSVFVSFHLALLPKKSI